MSTLEDVARLAGVSKATASRALSKPELVAAATIERVQRAAQELHFAPSRTATALASGRTGVIAMVVPTLENQFFTPIIQGAQDRADAAGYLLTVAATAFLEDKDVDQFARLAPQVDGFLLAAPRGKDQFVEPACKLKPTVLIDREIDGVPSVVADSATGFAELALRMVEQGHRHIALVGGPGRSWQNLRRVAHVIEALRGKAALTVLGPHRSTFAAGVGVVGEILTSGATAVISYSSSLSTGIMFGLQSRGITNLVVSADRGIADALGSANVPVLEVDGLELGRQAMDTLLARLDAAPGGEIPRLRLPVSVDWDLGEREPA
ncbi:LacI family transcriptional regulator [Mycetocola lacteus]|uniref:LacI family transcriptional regulator n=1 Tax=Mycetocola lacteus TaxID=76637 RepID=A0A3L7AML3_9MICO|nr:LacI family DNA-binding transcriptional regulator [Mycetocola lacteus]RLP81324.1 LacI family transcriptional regulator [Mycetocola lacteus]